MLMFIFRNYADIKVCGYKSMMRKVGQRMSQRGVPAVCHLGSGICFDPVKSRFGGDGIRRFWKCPVGNCPKTTSERLQSSPVTPLQS